MTIQATTHSGPIPSPQTLAEYNKLSPGLAERIVSMAELEQKQRHAIEMKNAEFDDSQLAAIREANAGDLSLKKRGQWFAIAAVTATLGFACYLANCQAYKTAGFVATAVVVSLAVVFVTGRAPEKRNLDENQE